MSQPVLVEVSTQHHALVEKLSDETPWSSTLVRAIAHAKKFQLVDLSALLREGGYDEQAVRAMLADPYSVESLRIGTVWTAMAVRRSCRIEEVDGPHESVYRFRYGDHILCPNEQLERGRPLPGMGLVVESLPDSLQPDQLINFMRTESNKLRGVCPREWLRQRANPLWVVEYAGSVFSNIL